MSDADLFDCAFAPLVPLEAFRVWRAEKAGKDVSWHSQAACGGTARIWRSVLSGKWMLTVVSRAGLTVSGRVASPEDGRALADQWLAEVTAALAEDEERSRRKRK